MAAFTVLPHAKPIKSSPNYSIMIRSLRHWRGWVAAGLILGLISATPTLPIPSAGSVANAATDIVCSGAGFGPSHGGIWLAKKTIQAQTATDSLDAQTVRTSTHAHGMTPTDPRFHAATPSCPRTAGPVYGGYADPVQITHTRAPPA